MVVLLRDLNGFEDVIESYLRLKLRERLKTGTMESSHTVRNIQAK